LFKEIPMTKERGGSIIFLAAGIYGLAFSLGLPLGKWNAPGPGVFPLTLSILLCSFGLVWFVQGGVKGAQKPQGCPAGLLGKSRTPFQIVGITAAFIFLLEPLGYLLASMLFTFALFFLVSRYRMGIAAALAVTFGAVSWVFFTKVLSTPLPQGVLWMF
jgi:putative tricarboxylic transport membrane protein